MPPLTENEKRKLLLQQEIAKLSGAISRHATGPSSHANSYHPYRGYSRGGRGGYSSRGRGRGRGGSNSLDLRAANRPTVSSSTAKAAPPIEKEEGEVPQASESSTAMEASGSGNGEGWVKKTSRGGNMSLMTVQKSSKLASRPPPPRKLRVPPQVQVLTSTMEESPGGSEAKRVVIDGVIFQFDEDGKKLVRIGDLTTGDSGTPTRSSLSYGGEKYRRTKRGNLISRSRVSSRRAEQAKRACRYFTKTGRCDRALTCPYKHEADRIAICPRFLRGACPLGADSCPLSHGPSAHNTPSCVHFQATATCRNGDSCLYPHVRVSEDAPVCEAFAREGWCDREAGTCPELHIWECPEWHAKGTCARGTRCGLRHVLRREKGKTAEESTPVAPEAAQGGFEDQSEYIGLPGEVVSETDESDESEEEDDDDEDEDDSGEEEENEDEDEEDNEDESEDDSMGVDNVTGKPPPSSSVMDTDDDDDEARVLDEV